VYAKTQLSFRFCNRAAGELKAVYKPCKDFNRPLPGRVERVEYSPRGRENRLSKLVVSLLLDRNCLK
jgi:hypothetical protein